MTSVLIPHQAQGGPNAAANLLLHFDSPASDSCFSQRSIPSCFTARDHTPLLQVPEYLYVLIEEGDLAAGIGGASFGVFYDGAAGSGVDILGWTLCADNQTLFGWPASNSGIMVTWNAENCQRRRVPVNCTAEAAAAVVGYFYCTAYNPSNLFLIPNPQDGLARVLDCAGAADTLGGVPSPLGAAGFGGASGYNPCSNPHLVCCEIIGPETCLEGSTVHYAATPAVGPEIMWMITGNGSIVGPVNELNVTVVAGTPGSFTLEFISYGGVEASHCVKTVSVEGAVPTQSTTWGRIKALSGRY